MNYDYKNDQKDQSLKLKNRNNLEISGVKKIESLNSEEFIINTILGILIVKGSNLEMQQLDIDKGLLWINKNNYRINFIWIIYMFII